MVKKKIVKSTAVVLLCGGALFSTGAQAGPVVDADIAFVIDSSGSMGGEFNFLGDAIGDFLSDLESSPLIGTARAALVEYNSHASLVQGLTSDPQALKAAFNTVSASGGTENAFSAIDAAITDLGINYGNANTVKSTILITDEDADDVPGYSNSFNTGSSTGDLLALLNANGFLNNIIYDFGAGDQEFRPVAVPNGSFFNINDFRSNRQQFFQNFTAAKIGEIEDRATVPAPGTIALLGAGFLGIWIVRRRALKPSMAI